MARLFIQYSFTTMKISQKAKIFDKLGLKFCQHGFKIANSCHTEYASNVTQLFT